MNRIKSEGSIAKIVVEAPWVISVNEIFHVDYSDEENSDMWSPTLFHAWRPLDDGGRLAIDVSNQHGTSFGVILALMLPTRCPSPRYLPFQGYTFSSVNDVVSCVESLVVEWKSKDPPRDAIILDVST